MFGTRVAKWGRKEVGQMTDGQIKQILMSMKKLDKGYDFSTTDRETQAHLDELAPYVIGYHRHVRGFNCDGLSAKGKELIG